MRPSRFAVDVAIIACFATSVSFFVLYIVRKPRPPVSIEPGFVDLGTVSQNESVPVAFRISNNTGERLTIRSTSKSCDCTRLKTTTQVLDAYGSMMVDILWDTGLKKGPSTTAFAVSFSTDDKRTTEVRGVVKAIVRADFFLDRSELVFSRKNADPITVKLIPSENETVVIEEAYTTYKAFKCRVDQDRRQVTVEIRPDELKSLEIEHVTLLIKTSSKKEQIASLPIRVRQDK